jgi:hypothetical protein
MHYHPSLFSIPEFYRTGQSTRDEGTFLYQPNTVSIMRKYNMRKYKAIAIKNIPEPTPG